MLPYLDPSRRSDVTTLATTLVPELVFLSFDDVLLHNNPLEHVAGKSLVGSGMRIRIHAAAAMVDGDSGDGQTVMKMVSTVSVIDGDV
jgi:energy-converting hydrogenase Eha subunit C